MEFRKKELANGLTIVGEINKYAKSVAVGFFVKVGSRDENKQINGVSHFLEHMLFKGSEKLSPIGVFEAFEKLGAVFNAQTNEEVTIYSSAVLPEYVIELTQLWVELMSPAFREDDINIEKYVVKEEIQLFKDIPSFDVMERCRSLHFDGHSCGNSVMGSRESIEALTFQQMLDYFNERYVPNNLVIACAGIFDWHKICSTIEASCDKWQKRPVVREFKHCQGSKKKQRIERAFLSREHIYLISVAPSLQEQARYAALLLSHIIGDIIGSRFYWELVDKDFADIATMEYMVMEDTGVLCSYIGCKSGNMSRVIDIVRDIFSSVAKNGTTEDELRRAKNKVLSSYAIGNELPICRLISLGLNMVYQKPYRSVKDYIKTIEMVTIDDIDLLVKRFNPGDFTQFSMGPS
jgi:predicted Zn-dependent peptidase